ncbi:2-dehydropantoate 2-reductase N-terminal domain-containing protein [Herbidospora sp. NBRC 101105]|uniref:ketopantoate reductase family protein n=1 Tax=Herbidospora sp. NBRC 101105 TaxID=3032195 RepID=UPI0024A1A4B1|nr:2-dehydropantoate 2-reductase N-terminal domain-containing protein [Herbidospora sp. NBRC 101105]GLX98657.1 2-dehydropantoate 2-reductase [Herbidospora sp. NBRC 101105]
MRYIIIGAGGIGGTIGARLFQSGHDVILSARGSHLAALRSTGLRFVTPNGAETLRIPAVGDPADLELREGDVLIVATKTQDTAAALAAWAPHADGLPVVCAQNAVENERLALRLFADVYGMLVWMPALHLEPGTIVAYGTPKSGMLPLGRYPQGVDKLSETVAADLDRSGFASWADPAIMRWKYGKLLGNLGNAVEALTGPDPAGLDLARRAREEGVAVLAAAGVDVTTPDEEQARRGRLVEHGEIEGVPRPGGSSWQSLAKGSGTIEADYLNGEIVLLGRAHGVATPVNAVLQREANRAARESRPPGSLSVAELTALM